MVIQGRVQNGAVILEGSFALPEGAYVSVVYPASNGPPPPEPKARIQVPLIKTGEPGSVQLTGRRISEILDDEDAAPRR